MAVQNSALQIRAAQHCMSLGLFFSMRPPCRFFVALSLLLGLARCSISRARAQTPTEKDLEIQFVNATVPLNDTTILPDPSSLDAYWPVTLATPNLTFLTLPTTNASSLDTLSAGPPKYTCNGKSFGRNLNVVSCTDALNSMSDFHLPRTFGERGEGDWDVPLPFRFLSRDGLCAIDVSHKAGTLFDTIIPTVMKLNVEALLNICVKGTPNQGGVATNIGENGALSVRMTPYRPNVHCEGPNTGPPPRTCRKILDQLPVDGTQRKFGRRDDPEAQVLVPRQWSTSERRCTFVVDTIFSTDVSDFYKLWAAAIAVEVMCVESRGEGGLGAGLGTSIPSA